MMRLFSKSFQWITAIIICSLLFLAGCITASPSPEPTAVIPTGTTTPTASPSPTPPPTNTPVPTTALPPTDTPTPSPTPQPPLRFAVIGDYGTNSQAEADVASLIQNWGPDIILTMGDNNYPAGSPLTIDDNIGKYFHAYIYPYLGNYSPGGQANRFFPSLGNHDWDGDAANPYLNYFQLPGNERYYDFIQGPVHFFALDSDSREPDGVGRQSVQAQWLQSQLAASTSIWNIVYFHHAPYSSGLHGPVEWMRWPFAEWGADVVLSGHDHTYERLIEDGIPYIVNGLGGGAVYDFVSIQDGSQFRYNQDYGALFGVASADHLDFQFINRQGDVIDTFTLDAAP